MYTKRTASFGLNTNVSLDPSATSTSTASPNQSVNNKIIIQPLSSPGSEVKYDIKTDEPTLPVTRDVAVEQPTYPSVEGVIVPPVTSTLNDVQKLLLDIYSAILLTQNKQLLANIMSKSSIIITKSDLERVIATKIKQQCSITVDDPTGCGCCAKVTGIHRIDQIRIVTDTTTVDFKQAFNSDYNELIDVYRLSLKYVII